MLGTALQDTLLLACCQSTGLALRILTSVVGLSVESVCTFPRRFTTDMPEHTRPNIVCLPSKKGVGARLMKNCSRTPAHVSNWAVTHHNTGLQVRSATHSSQVPNLGGALML